MSPRLLRRNALWLGLALLAVSETLVVQWALLLIGRSGLGWLGGIAGVVGFAALNLATAVALRKLSWDIRPVWVLSRIFMVGSLGALMSGPLLILASLVAGLSLWVLNAFDGAADLKQTAFLAGGGVAIGLGFGSMLWGFLIGQRRVQVDRLDLPIRDLPSGIEGLRIAHITDLHIGRQLRAPKLRRFVERVNAVEADMIVITGDIFDFDPRFIEEGCLELAKLEAPLGVFAVLGNHDVYTGADLVADGIKRLTTIRLLRDEWVQLDVQDEPFCVVGIEDPGKGWTERDSESPALARLAREIPQGMPRLLLIHRPSFFRQAAALGFPISLAGHTHGGQISLPPPAHHHNVSRLVAHWTRGLFEEGDSLLYVNRGLGVAGPPVRINCPREIALLRMVARR